MAVFYYANERENFNLVIYSNLRLGLKALPHPKKTMINRLIISTLITNIHKETYL